MIHESASVIARKIAAAPARTSTETWQAVVDLVAEPGSAPHQELTAIGNLAAILISEEYTRDAPMVVLPAVGPRIRVRTAHGLEAIEAIGQETPLYGGRLSESGWTVSLPCAPDDLDEITAALAGVPAVTVRDMAEGLDADTAPGRSVTGTVSPLPVFDLDEMRRA